MFVKQQPNSGSVTVWMSQSIWNRGLKPSEKSIDKGQPALSAQADLCRYFLLFVHFLNVSGSSYLMNRLVVSQNEFIDP